jgi:ribosomal protein S27AE
MPAQLKACPLCNHVFYTENNSTCGHCGPIEDQLIVIEIPKALSIIGVIPTDHPAAPECYWSYKPGAVEEGKPISPENPECFKEYTGSCGFTYVDIDGTVEEDFAFCPGCGQVIKNMGESDGM